VATTVCALVGDGVGSSLDDADGKKTGAALLLDSKVGLVVVTFSGFTVGDKAGWSLGIPGGNDEGVAVGSVEVNRVKIADTRSVSSSVLLLGYNVGDDNELSVSKETSGEPVAGARVGIDLSLAGNTLSVGEGMADPRWSSTGD